MEPPLLVLELYLHFYLTHLATEAYSAAQGAFLYMIGLTKRINPLSGPELIGFQMCLFLDVFG